MPDPGGSPPVIALRNVERVYQMGEVLVQALRGVSLVVENGEFVALMGASGSGKSTLMNVIGCLDVPTYGRYWIDGVDVRKSRRGRRWPGYATARSASSSRAST